MSSGRLRTILLVSLIVVLALLVVGGLRWVQYVRSPQYSVEQLARAATAKDWEGVQKYVDVDAVVGDQVDKRIDGTVGGDDTLLGESGDWLGELTKPKATQLAKGMLRTAILAGPNRPGTAVDLAGLFARQSVKSVTFEGDEALVIAEARFGDKRVVRVTLRMKRIDNYWRVVAVEGLRFLMREDVQGHRPNKRFQLAAVC